jgi:hypothetical protein
MISEHVTYFSNFFHKYPDQFRTCVRSLIATGAEKDWQCLEYLTKNMDQKDLTEIMFGLTSNEKETWSTSIGKVKTTSEDSLVKYLKSKLVGSLIAFQPMVDSEVWEMSLRLRVSEVVSFCDSYHSEGATLLNILTPVFLSKIFDTLDVNKSAKIMEQALEGDLNAVEVQKLKIALTQFVSSIKSRSFTSKIFKALSSIEASKEKMVYRHLLNSVQPSELVDIVASNFPLDLLWHLSSNFQKDVLQSYPLVKKAQLLLSLNEDEREKLIETIGSNGSSARQMLDMEISRIQDNPSDLRRCQIQKDFILREFIAFTRSHIASNPSLMPEIKSASLEWLSTLDIHRQNIPMAKAS